MARARPSRQHLCTSVAARSCSHLSHLCSDDAHATIVIHPCKHGPSVIHEDKEQPRRPVPASGINSLPVDTSRAASGGGTPIPVRDLSPRPARKPCHLCARPLGCPRPPFRWAVASSFLRAMQWGHRPVRPALRVRAAAERGRSGCAQASVGATDRWRPAARY
jgi:hypothetical protein